MIGHKGDNAITVRLSQPAAQLRRWLLNETVTRKRPLSSAEIIADYPLAAGEPLAELVETRAIVMDEAGSVNFLYPVSALATHHKVTLSDGRDLYAMCAVDALGVAFAFEMDTRIISKCSFCGKEIEIRMQGGKIAQSSSGEIHVLHVDLSAYDNWATTC
ncbi:MAG TPA: MerB-like organometallic lyase SaoL [Dissulfurispiraceae bacterium]|nr:MerB-like organometallic lyase SaoL [Dissulfurispiraceae bacterium]